MSRDFLSELEIHPTSNTGFCLLEPQENEESPYAEAVAAARRAEPDEVVRGYMEKSIADSDPRAEYSLATWHLFGAYGLPCAPELALGHLERAAAGGVREAMYNLGVSFDLGKGVARDAHKAFLWYLKAGVRGDPEGVRQVANCYASGSGVPKDVDSALVWYEWAEALGADEGDAADFRAWMKKNEPDPTRPSGGRGGRGRCPKR